MSKTQTRNAMIDHIRIVLTAIVILHHAAIVYGGSGGWYWREQPNASNTALLMFNTINQAYFMGFFFLLAGYYTPSSFERKGALRFIGDRLLRLGVPLIVYFFVLTPLTVALARTSEGLPFWSGWLEMTRSGVFGPGPLWFAEALLLFAGAYVVWRKFRAAPSATTDLPGFGALALTAVLLGGASFLGRLAIPVGKEFASMQLGYFPCYIYLFAAGCASSRSRLLERITFRQARPWMVVSLLALVTLPAVAFLDLGQGDFKGGASSRALYYALWDPFVAWGVILGALCAARSRWSQATALTTWLAKNAYGAYIVHPPIVVGASLAAATWAVSPMTKLAFVGGAACVGSFLAASVLRAVIPGARRIL